ncbi:hypothetical protein [Paenibacillus ferrarius]|uniref:hypothetical protein n=1 Tax=Paenibacillus ferrarius TaxID=1469647 RepID=UPI003D2AA2A5
MARRNKQSISTFLVSAVGMLCTLKVFVWVMETKVLHTPIEIPFLNYGIIIGVVLLVLRITSVLIMNNVRKSKRYATEAANAISVPLDVDAFYCASCGNKVSEKVRNYCLERPNKFNNQVFCYEHQR